MFGFFEAIYAFLTRQLGTRNDAANANGSLHAKIGDVNNQIDMLSNTLQKPRGVANVGSYTSPGGSEYTTAYSTTGKGRVVYLRLGTSGASASSNTCLARVISDGILVPIIFTGQGTQMDDVYVDIEFKSSLSIEVTTSGGLSSQYALCTWVVEKE